MAGSVNARVAGAVVLALTLIGGASVYVHFFNTWYALDRSRAYLSRAETAGFAEGMTESITEALELIPMSGNPVWWFPTARTDFQRIRQDLNEIIERAAILSSIPRDGDAYQQGMDDLRGKLKTIQEQLGEASAFFFVNPFSLVLSFFWVVTVAILLALRSRPVREQPEDF